jgi:hypothetical protein
MHESYQSEISATSTKIKVFSTVPDNSEVDFRWKTTAQIASDFNPRPSTQSIAK